ncbi:MAG: nucleotidyltransferase family protein [Bacilli bacterium]|nr:nucleotidyltransferase family protein [Bacilli bacterium]MBQ8472080.1 nucleotidyltransferase family protein [Bacilli bacterium]
MNNNLNKPLKVLGLILEINPFHNGHQYFINEAINQVKPDVVIAVVSTSFTMRGNASLINKFDKTTLLLNNNIDLVVELPVSKALNSADFFGKITVKSLIDLGITDLAFGVENSDISVLSKLYELTNTFDYQKQLNLFLHDNLSYKKASSKALASICCDEELINLIDKPNITLGLQYYKTIMNVNPQVNVHLIKRVDNYYQNTTCEFLSAYTIREKLKNNENINEYLPYDSSYLNKIDENLLFNLIKYKLLVDNKNIKNIHLVEEGIDNYLINNFKGNNLNELLNNLNNKKYSKSRILRTLMCILLDIPKDYNLDEEYLRVLGFNDKGQLYLNTLPKNIKNRLKTSLKHDSTQTGLIELNATKLYSLLINQDLNHLEYKIPIKNIKGE